MKILYLISKYATFFGALIKGLWEHIMCGILKVFVEDGRYLQPTESCGHVEHEFTKGAGKTFALTFFPSLLNAVLAFFLGGAGFMGLFIIKSSPSSPIFWVYIVLLYLGISFFCNIFPLFEDALNNWSQIYQTTLSEEDIALNKELEEKIKAQKAYAKEAKKIAKQKAKEGGSKKTPYDPFKDKQAPEKITKEVGIFTKIILFIPSVLMMAGSFLEKYGLTFIISIAAVIIAIFIS